MCSQPSRFALLTLGLCGCLFCAPSALAREYHVSTKGSDANDGSLARPYRNISQAARAAQPGDIITVHAGVYRERIDPPRGGTSEKARIVYRAAPGEQVCIRGSEPVRGWEHVQGDTWKVTLPNSFFGAFNPYRETIHGDWFGAQGRAHHPGAVYLDGHWLTEAAKLDEVLAPVGSAQASAPVSQDYLLNVAWMRLGQHDASAPRIAATSFTSKEGTQNAPGTEGDCVGFITHGHWLRYDRIDFGERTSQLDIRAASASEGGIIEVRLQNPDGDLLGKCAVPNTGGWQSWETYPVRLKPLSGPQNICLVFKAALTTPITTARWFGQVDETRTTLWAQFKDVNPNEQAVEINVRQTVFYPSKPGVNFLTVRGFTLEHAATPWAPPTAEQMGLIGTHWSKGWIIENNTIRYSRCSGVALGKYGDEWDNRAESAEGYVGTINRALQNGWHRDNIGHHMVRNNHISHCEQTGVVGSLGCAFSTVTGNEIHDIHVIRLFSGAEMAGIKFHGAIDVEISRNHIYRTTLGIWLDWMAQGAHVTGNLLHDNRQFDLFLEVDHGPFQVDNNLFLSRKSQLIVSQGGAYAHNLITGGLDLIPFDGRLTPYHEAHATAVAGLTNNPCGDVRYYHNIFAAQGDISPYDKATLPVWMDGNIYLRGAKATRHEAEPTLLPDFDAGLKLTQKPDGYYLEFRTDRAWGKGRPRTLVTTEILGRAAIPNLPFENPDGSARAVDTDYFGKKRDRNNPFPGPFEKVGTGKQSLKVWPLSRR